jgi:membrane protein implicated in regulation of membrane protease activity
LEFTLMFWIWVAIAAVFTVAEIFTAGFFLFPFAVGAGLAAVANFLGLPQWLQWLCFLGISGALVAASRRLADRFSHEPPEKAGVDRLIGGTGLVIEAIDPVSDSGRIRIKKEEWRATSSDDSKIDINQKVRVVRVEGTHLVVEKEEPR